MKVILDNGKYEVIFNGYPRVEFKALRNKEEWRNLVGDNLVLALVQRIDLLRDCIKNLDNFDCIYELQDNHAASPGWYYEDETNNYVGPYPTKLAAKKAFIENLLNLEGDSLYNE
jgi:hypothetical protein